MPRESMTCTGTVLIEKHTDPPAYEIVSLHFADGGTAVTIADILFRLGLAVNDQDRLKITVGMLPAKRSRKRR